MAGLAVIGNISRDVTRYPGAPDRVLIGGAALHIARAATRADLPATPVAVIGRNLRTLRTDPRLSGIDLSGVLERPGRSAQFTLAYDHAGALVHVEADYQEAAGLTAHALAWCASNTANSFHVCCRRPLDGAAVLQNLVSRARPFSADFYTSSAAETISAAGPFLGRARAVFANAAEAEILAAHLPAREMRALVVTDGPRPVSLYRCGRLSARIRPPTAAPVEVTGAGDTLTGTLLAGWASALADVDALRRAVAAASAHTTAPPLSAEP